MDTRNLIYSSLGYFMAVGGAAYVAAGAMAHDAEQVGWGMTALSCGIILKQRSSYVTDSLKELGERVKEIEKELAKKQN